MELVNGGPATMSLMGFRASLVRVSPLPCSIFASLFLRPASRCFPFFLFFSSVYLYPLQLILLLISPNMETHFSSLI